jgi:hypothetical protein
MPYCPDCRTEYRPDVLRCAHCEVELVAALPETDAHKDDRLRQALKEGEGKVAQISLPSYAEACQMVEFLSSKGVAALVSGDPEMCGKGCAQKFFVAVLPEDAPEAGKVLRAEQKRLVESDEECRGADLDAVVDFDAEGEKKGPACGAAFEGTPEECPDCGIFLGAPQ